MPLKQEYLTPFPIVSGPEKFYIGVKCSRVTNQNSSDLGLLQHLISGTVPTACVSLNIGGHNSQRTSKEKRMEEIKYFICTQNTPVMS